MDQCWSSTPQDSRSTLKCSTCHSTCLQHKPRRQSHCLPHQYRFYFQPGSACSHRACSNQDLRHIELQDMLCTLQRWTVCCSNLLGIFRIRWPLSLDLCWFWSLQRKRCTLPRWTSCCSALPRTQYRSWRLMVKAAIVACYMDPVYAQLWIEFARLRR